MATESATHVYEDVFKNLRKATEASLKMQQEALHQWTKLWPGLPSPQTVWIDKFRDFQRQWANTVADLARKHRDTLNRQYQVTLESLEEALRVGESSDPEEFRKRTEQFCRKSLDCMREVAEEQMKEFQEALSTWSDLATQTKT
jgi:hypothetical protein